MAQSLVRRVKAEMFRVIFSQLLMVLGVTLVFFALKGLRSGLSVLAGALAYWLPTLGFIWRVSSQASVTAGARFLAVFIAGEGVKLLACGILFVVSIKYFHAQILDAVIGLAVAIVAFWIASFVSIYKQGLKV